MLFRTQLSIICVESFFQNHNIFMIMVISGGHYESGVLLLLNFSSTVLDVRHAQALIPSRFALSFLVETSQFAPKK